MTASESRGFGASTTVNVGVITIPVGMMLVAHVDAVDAWTGGAMAPRTAAFVVTLPVGDPSDELLFAVGW